MAKKKKVLTAVAAMVTAAAIMLGGTFAWQSISQTALNEASDVINPGGRLHDDFNGENKDVYVENFAEEDIYARIRLSEYFEIVTNYGKEDLENREVLLGGEDDAGERTYSLFTGYDSLDENGVVAGAAKDADGNAYWNWTTGGSTVYMPTFNMNKDSLAADINGIYEDGNVGTISDRILDLDAEDAQYSQYNEYEEGDTLTGDEIYDADANDVEDDGITTVADVEHTAKATGNATLMSMQEWIDAGSQPGEYWVYDTDGWVYWAQAIEPHTATGLLLDGIELNQVMDDTWYYAINVEAQFVTADDVGKVDGTGFYAEGTAPSTDAESLLKAIGVFSVDEEAGEEEGDTEHGFRIYSHSDDEGTNYANGRTVTLSAGTYDLYVSNGSGGHYVGENPNNFTWSVSDGLTYTSGVTEYNAEGNDYYVSIEFTLDETVPAGTYTVTATNETDNITRTAYIVWDGTGSTPTNPTQTETLPPIDFKNLDYLTDADSVTVYRGTTYEFSGNDTAWGSWHANIYGAEFESTDNNHTSTVGTHPEYNTVLLNIAADEPNDKLLLTVTFSGDSGEECYASIWLKIESAAAPTDAGTLQNALNEGGRIDLGNTEVNVENPTSFGTTIQTGFYMFNGGTLNGGVINGEATTDENNGDSYTTLFISDGDVAADTTVNNTKINAESDYGVYVQTGSLNATLNGVTIDGKFGGLLAEYNTDGSYSVNLNNVTINAHGEHKSWYVNSAVAAANGAIVNVNSGSYTGTQALTVFSSGGTINVYSGTFNGEIKNDADAKGSINIYGGTFNQDPGDFVANGYEAVNNDDGTWTVQEKWKLQNTSEEFKYEADGTLYIEVDRIREQELKWNLWGASDSGEFTLSSTNSDVWFIEYYDYSEEGSNAPDNTGSDMYVIIPVSVTDSFTVTATQGGGDGVMTIEVRMIDNNG